MKHNVKKLVLLLSFFIILVSCTDSYYIKKALKTIDEGNLSLVSDLISEGKIETVRIDELLEYSLRNESINYTNMKNKIISNEKIEIITFLIEKCSNPNIILNDGSGLIFWSFTLKDDRIFKTLLGRSDININLEDEFDNNFAAFKTFIYVDDQLFKNS